ncbi:ATP-binding protein [Streptomyces sp. NPDC059477]|uniref:ATP-binding protein n=1 Tax=Streptomyces sp. NPDC059477 TaxID=3346847 RepID=UPI0036A31011
MATPLSPQQQATVRVFTERLPATPRCARLARFLARTRLDIWGIPHGSDVSERVALVVAELAANAVTHGRVPGRDFELRLSVVTGSVRIEVTDTRSESRPPGPGEVGAPGELDESGRGLMLVAAVADRWEVLDRQPGKTVRAEVDVPGWLKLFGTMQPRRVGDREETREQETVRQAGPGGEDG